MKSINGSFSPQRLRIARSFHGLSSVAFAERVGISQQYVSSLENETRRPSDMVLAALSDVLLFDPPFFFDEPLDEFQESECHFRKRRTTPKRISRQALAHGTCFNMLVAYLDTNLSLPKMTIPELVPATFLELDDIAGQCRINWKLGTDTPITNMTRVLENAGAVVTKFTGETAKVDAFSRYGRRPIVVLNDITQSTSRLVWDGAHELGHLVMHRQRLPMDNEREREADAFAGAFLLPRKAFGREFGRGSINWSLLFELKRRWRTSLSAMIMRVYELGLIDAVERLKAYKHIRYKKWHVGEPFEPNSENAETVEISLGIMDKKGQPPAEVARRLHWRLEIMDELLGRPVLRPPGELAAVRSISDFRSRQPINDPGGKQRMTTQIQETTESPVTWAQRPFICADLRPKVASAAILLVPSEGYGDRRDLRFFPSGSSNLYAFLKQELPEGTAIEACINDDDYREVARHASVLYLASLVVTTVAAPLLVNLITEYIKAKIAGRGEATTLQTSVTFHNREKGRSIRLDYNGPATAFRDTALDVLARMHEAADLGSGSLRSDRPPTNEDGQDREDKDVP
jgi:Zn-dependent peptidase ImmA (M78 family)/transcriptional regulator with XRE-family HTH domain